MRESRQKRKTGKDRSNGCSVSPVKEYGEPIRLRCPMCKTVAAYLTNCPECGQPLDWRYVY